MRSRVLAGLLLLSIVFLIVSGLSLACSSTEESKGNETPTGATNYAYTTVGPIYMTMEGVTQGAINGSLITQGNESAIPVYGFSHEMTVPFYPTSGLPSGKKTHSPLKVVKMFDEASPRLYQALIATEHMKYVNLGFYRIGPTGGDELYFTIRLEDAVIVSIKPYISNIAGNSTDGRVGSYLPMEEVTFTYKKIIWTYVPEGIQTGDTWQLPKSG